MLMVIVIINNIDLDNISLNILSLNTPYPLPYCR